MPSNHCRIPAYAGMTVGGCRWGGRWPECIVVNHQQGNDWQNVNFHLRPELIAELDWLHLGALGYEGEAGERLLGQLRKMRSSSSWDYGG